ncbi:MAG: isoprenylcysteine carboxylmethyltransferase family protein [Chloroflexi bacterium]|nr:isoprenylcysteine carboxylmethyltransferase family protein [Chloroflexota bacterium]
MQTVLTIVYFAGMLAQIVVRTPYAMKGRKLDKVTRQAAASEQLVLGILTFGGLVLPLAYALTDWFAFADYPSSASTKIPLAAMGILILGTALWLFWRAHHDLGAYWSPSLEFSANQPLITDGVYGSMRHPMYASQLLFGLSQALLLQNWIAGLGGLITFLLLYFVRVPKEEVMMLGQFGEQYRDYCERTGRILPRLGRQNH